MIVRELRTTYRSSAYLTGMLPHLMHFSLHKQPFRLTKYEHRIGSMTPLIVIGLIVGLPTVLIFQLRVNAVTALLSLCAGDVLQRLVGKEAAIILGSFSSKDDAGVSQLAHLILLILPLLFAIIFLRKSVSRSKSILNLFPAIAAGVLTGILTVPLLPGGLRHNIVKTDMWSQVSQYQSTIVAVVMLVAFFMLWLISPKPDKDKKHKK